MKFIFGLFLFFSIFHSELVLQAASLPPEPTPISGTIFQAIENGNLETVKSMIEKDETLIESTDVEKLTPLHLAVEQGKLEIVEFLVKYLQGKGKDINPALTAGDYEGFTPLHFAAMSQDKDIPVLEFLIKQKVNVNTKDKGGNTPLHIVVHQAIYNLENKINIDALKFLINHGAKVNIKNNGGNTPLHIVVQQYQINIDALKFLIKHRANVNDKNNAGRTPLLIVGLKDKIDKDALEFLIKHGANVNDKDNAGNKLLSRFLTKNNPNFLFLLKKIDPKKFHEEFYKIALLIDPTFEETDKIDNNCIKYFEEAIFKIMVWQNNAAFTDNTSKYAKVFEYFFPKNTTQKYDKPILISDKELKRVIVKAFNVDQSLPIMLPTKIDFHCEPLFVHHFLLDQVALHKKYTHFLLANLNQAVQFPRGRQEDKQNVLEFLKEQIQK